jgi:hypothetical protein
VWAVGWSGLLNGGHFSLLVAHWDGVVWSKIDVPSAPAPVVDCGTYCGAGGAYSVFGLSSSQVWISGTVYTSAFEEQAYVLGWDGVTFREVAPRMTRPRAIGLGSVWATGASDIWLPGQPAMHFDGAQWMPVGDGNSVKAIYGTTAQDVWLVGDGPQGGEIRHWDGKTLSTRLDASPRFTSIASTPQGDFLWTVGEGGATLRLASSRAPAR